MLQRFKWTALALGLAIALTGACQERGATASSKLIYWPPPNRFDIEMSHVLVERWNREHPDVQVEMQPLPAGRSSEEVLLAAIVGKTTPDICSNILSGTVERMVRAGALVPLSDLHDFAGTVEARSPAGTLEAFRSSDGKVYQMPWKANPQLLMVNTGLLAKYGVTTPQLRTYSGFLAAAKRLSGDDDGDGRFDRWAIGLHIDNTWWKRFDDLYPLYIAASGGQTLLRGREVLFDGPAMVQALGFARDLFTRGYAPRTYFARQLFLQQKVAMVAGSGPSIPDLEQKKPPGMRYAFVPMPVPDSTKGPHSTFADIKSMVVFSSCKRPKQAWRFIQYLTSAKADLLLLKMASQLPLRRDLLTCEPFASYLRSKPNLVALAHQMKHVRGTDDTVHLVEIFDTLSQAYEVGAVYGLRSPKQAVHKAAARVRRILKMWD